MAVTISAGSSFTIPLRGSETITVASASDNTNFSVQFVPSGIPVGTGGAGRNFGPMATRITQGPYGTPGTLTITNNSASTGVLTVTGTGFSPYVLAQSAVPVILLSSATAITATGAITGLTALPYTPSGVVQVYVDLSGIGGVKGLYYARFSSTTACQLYTDAAGTVTPTGLTAGAYAGLTGEQVLASILVPAGSMGPNGSLRMMNIYSFSNSANMKSGPIRANGTQLGTWAATTMSSVRLLRKWSNRGASNVNVSSGGALETAAASLTYTAIDTSQNVTLTLAANLANAADFISLEEYLIEVVPGL